MSLRSARTFVAVLAAAMAAAVVAAAPVPAAEPGELAGKVNADVVRLRAGPGTQYTIVGRVALGQKMAVLGEKEGWYMVPFPADRWCWITKRYVRKLAKTSGGAIPGVVSANEVRIRAAGDLRSKIVAVRNAGDKVSVIGEVGDWYKIVPPREARAWIYKEYVDILEGKEAPKIEDKPEPPAALVGPPSPVTDDVSDEPLGKTGGVGGLGERPAEGYRTRAEPPEPKGSEIPGVDLAGMSAKERLATAQGIFQAGCEEKNSDRMVTAGMIFASLANDYFTDNATRSAARERLRAVVVELPQAEQRKIIAFESKALKAQVQRIRSHYNEELSAIEVPVKRRKYTAIGVVEAMPRARRRPGDYRLVVGVVPYYYLRSRRIDLRPYVGKTVGIVGRIEPAPIGWTSRVLTVSVIEALPELEE